MRLITAKMEKVTAQRAEQAAQKVKEQLAQEQAQGNRKLHRGLAAYAVPLAVLVLVAPHFARPSVVFNMNGGRG